MNNILASILGVVLIGVLAFGLFDERHRAKADAVRADSLRRADTKQYQAQVRNLVATAQQQAKDSHQAMLRMSLEALLRLQKTSLSDQQRETISRLIASRLLARGDSSRLPASAGQVRYDSLQQTAITLAITQRDSLSRSGSDCELALALTRTALAEKERQAKETESELEIWYNTHGIASGKNRRLKKAYQRLSHP